MVPGPLTGSPRTCRDLDEQAVRAKAAYEEVISYLGGMAAQQL
ncbi:hypothetical protein [Actinomadura sp. NPDC048394]